MDEDQSQELRSYLNTLGPYEWPDERDIARVLGVSKEDVYKMVRTKILPEYDRRRGRSGTWEADTLLEYLDQDHKPISDIPPHMILSMD